MKESIELGFFGNIWVRQNVMEGAGESFPGHKHKFDNVTLLSKGEIEVEVEGYEPKIFKAPTFVVVRKEHNHKITALTDDVLYYCVFAVRDLDGKPVDEIIADEIDPMSAKSVADDYWDKKEN